jgi:5'-nucleotidase/UDP-sugar diphosphatase
VRRANTIVLAFALAIAGLGVAAPAMGAGPFTDVDTNSIFADDISWFGDQNITLGCNPPTNDQYCPDDQVTRGQMAAFFVRALGLTETAGGTDFTDTDGIVFENDILKLSAAGITKGCNPPANDQFCPGDPVSRAEMAAFFVRALGLTETAGGTDFTDTDGIVFENDILKLSAAGITKGCNPPANDQFCPNEFVTRAQMAAFFRRAIGGSFDLTIAHMNDHHSNLEPRSQTLLLDGEETDVETGGFARVVTKFDLIEESAENLLKVHAGDAITGTLFYTLFAGQADADVMNEVCFDVFELGNHEFDDSDANLAQFLDWLNAGGCGTATLAANVVPAAGTPLADGYLEPYTIVNYLGRKVGVIGIDFANKTKNSSQPLATTQFLDEADTTQKYVDELEAMGVDHIVVVTHHGYGNDQALAAAVDGVDVIIGGDSHTLLGNGFTAFGLGPAGPYPTMAVDAGGDPVCIAHAWQYSEMVGQLDVTWNEDGVVTECGGAPTLLLGDTFTREVGEDDVELTGADLAAVLAEIEGTPLLEVVEPDPATAAIIADYATEVDALAAETIATANSHFCLERIPGQDYRVSPSCPAGYGAANGGDAQQLVAQAFLARAFAADLSVQNAGGVRVEIEVGDFSIADAYTVLPFSNTLVNMELTGQEIVDVLNEAFTYALDPTGSTGAYPYGSGIRWTTNFNTGEITDVEVNPRNAGTWAPIDLTATYTVATNDFIAKGQDGYATFGAAWDAGRYVDTFINYAQGLIDYAEDDAAGVLELPTDYSTNAVIGTYSP